jgi:hypothetical protein
MDLALSKYSLAEIPFHSLYLLFGSSKLFPTSKYARDKSGRAMSSPPLYRFIPTFDGFPMLIS